MDTSPSASNRSSDYPESNDTSWDGFLSWDRSRQSAAYRDNHANDDEHVMQQNASVVQDDINVFGNDGAHDMYQQQQQEQHQIRSKSLPPERNSQQYQKSDESEDSDDKAIHSPTPFRPMAPREFALGNTLRRSHSAMPMATLPADATVARKGSQDGGSHYGGTPSHSVASASFSSSMEHSEVEALQKLIQQQQMQTGIPQLPLSQNQPFRRQSTEDSMQRISENSGDSSDSVSQQPEQSAGQHAGGEGFQQTAGEAAGESPSEQASDRASDRNYRQNDRDEAVHVTGEQLNEIMRTYPVEIAAAAAEEPLAEMVEATEEEKNRESLGYLSDDFQVYEGDMMESHNDIYTGGERDDNKILLDISDVVEEGESSQDGIVQKQSEPSSSSHSSISSATGGYENVDDDENDVEDISYAIGTEMGLHSRNSIDESDISDTASEQESSGSSVDNEKMETENNLDSVRQQNDIDTRQNEMGGQYIDHYITSEDEGAKYKIQTHLPAKRPFDSDAAEANSESTDHKIVRDSVSSMSASDRFPLTSQTIAIADNADTQEASGAITARFGRLLQECRDLTETCGDNSVRDSMTSSYFGSVTKTASSKGMRSSTTETEANEVEERGLSSSQLKAAAAMAAANSSSLQRRAYTNPVTQKHEIDTSDRKHLYMSQLTVDPALQSSMMSADWRGSMMSNLKSSTLTGLMNSAEIKETQSSDAQSAGEFDDPNQSEASGDYAETFRVPMDQPLGGREPRPAQPMAGSVKSFVSELSLGVDAMYGDADEDTRSGNLNEDVTAPFDPSQFLAELEPSSFGADNKSSQNASSASDSASNKDEEIVVLKTESNEAASAPAAAAVILANKPSQITGPARPLYPSYTSGASHMSSDFSADEDGLLVGFGQRNVKRSIITSKSSGSSSTSSGAFSSGSDSSSDETTSSGSSGSSSSSSDDDSDSSSDGLDNIARDGLRIQSSRDSVSELSFGGASALMALQARSALSQFPNKPSLREEEEGNETDQIHSTPTGSKHSSNESDQYTMNDSSRSERRTSLFGDADQLEKLEEVSESTASDFLDDVSSIGDNNNAVQKFFSSPANEHEIVSNASALWSSATSTGLRNIPVDKLLSNSFSSSSSPSRNVNTQHRLFSSPKSSSFRSRSISSTKSFRSQGTGVSGDNLETAQGAKSSSTLSSLSQNIPIQHRSTLEAANDVPAVLTNTKAEIEEGVVTKRGSDSPSSLGSPGSRRNSITRWKSINSSNSQDSSGGSSGSYYKQVLARAAAMNHDKDNDVQIPQDRHEDEYNVVQNRSYSHNLENLLEASPFEDDAVQLQEEQDHILHEDILGDLETSPSLHNDLQKTIVSPELREEVVSVENDDISSMSSVVSKARTSKRASFVGIEAKQKEEPKTEPVHRQLDNQSMKSSYSYDGGELYEDFPSEKDGDEEVIRRNRSSASQTVSEKVETDARRPWKTAAREEEAGIPDESVLSAQTGSQRSSVICGQNELERSELHEQHHSDDDTSDGGSLSELFGSKEVLKRMGLYSSAIEAEPKILGSEEDVLSGASDQNQNEPTPRSSIGSIKQPPPEEETNIVGSLKDSIRSSIQSIKEQFFGEARSNYSKSIASGQSIGSSEELSDGGQEQQTLSVTSNENSDGSLSLPKTNEADENPMKSSAKMLAETARNMTTLLDHSMSSRSLKASKEHEPKISGARKKGSVSSASEEEAIAEDAHAKVRQGDSSTSSHSKVADDQSISIDSLDDIESRIEVFKKKNKPAVENTSQDDHRVSFADNVDEEIALPPVSQGDDNISSRSGSKTPWWRESLTKPRFICGSAVIVVLIILFSSIGATISKKNRSLPTSQPTASPVMLMANWIQLGGDLKGEMPGDEAGFSVSASENGSTVVVGARRNGDKIGGTENRGAAQIFRFDELSGFYKPIWVYYGEASGDQCGFSVAMSKDGKRMAVGCPGSDTYGKNSGKVRLFMEEEMSKSWVMVSEFYGEGSGDLFGAAVSLSPEGTKLAVGAPYYTRNEVMRSGSAYAFREISESVWQPSGDPMRGVLEESLFGWSVSLSPGGMFLAVGAPEMSESSLNGGFVKVFSFEADGSDWQGYGDPISNGVPGDRFGFSVSIAGDETLQRVAIGAPGNSANVQGSGLASVYEHSGNGWSNAVDDLIGESQDENLGYAVSLTPSANRLVVGVPKKQISGEIVGQVKVFNVGYGILTPDGEKYGQSGEKFGVSVAISNNGKRFFGGATDANLVRAYENIPIVNFNN